MIIFIQVKKKTDIKIFYKKFYKTLDNLQNRVYNKEKQIKEEETMRRIWKGIEKLENYRITAEGENGGIAAEWKTKDFEEANKFFGDYKETYSSGIRKTYYIITLYNNDIAFKRAFIRTGF